MKKGIVTASNEELREWCIGNLKQNDEVLVKEKNEDKYYFQKEENLQNGFYSAPKEFVKIIEEDNFSKNKDMKKRLIAPQFGFFYGVAFGYTNYTIEDIMVIHNYHFLCFTFSYAISL